MKRIALLIILALMLTFCGCQKPVDDPIDNPPIDDPADDPTDTPEEPEKPEEPEEPEKPDEPVIEGDKAVYVLVATFTNNSRMTNPASTSSAENEHQLVFASLKTGPKAAGIKTNLLFFTFDGNTSQFDALVGQPVEIIYQNTEVKKVSALPSVQGCANDFTADENNCYFKGSTISVDRELLTEEKTTRAWCQAISGIWTEYTPEEYIFNCKADEIFTLTDSDRDGVYDFFCEYRVVNGLQINLAKSQEGGKIFFTNCGYGSQEYSGWFTNNGMNYRLCGELEGKTLQEVGECYLNVRVYRNSVLGAKITNSVCAYCEIYPCNTVTGLLEDYGPKDYDALSFEDNTVKVAGVTYEWSDRINSNDLCDGTSGLFAGRLLNEGNLNREITLVRDMAGNVVKADCDQYYDESLTYTTFESANGTQAAAVFDVQGWWHGSVTTYDQLKKKAELLYSTGIRRLYVVTCNEGYPQFSNNSAGRSSLREFDKTVETFKKLGYQSPDHALAKICHDLNMECYAVYKIYEGGGMETVPYGYSYDPTFDAFEGFGGWTVQLDSFITENLKKGIDYRICRRPDGANDNLDGIVDKVTIDFVSGAFTQRGGTQTRTETNSSKALSVSEINSIADGKVYTNRNNHPTRGINVWVSKDNSAYSLYQGDYSYTYVTGYKVLYDANGDAMFDGKKIATITLEITGLSVEEYYVAVSFENGKNLRTDPLSFMHIYSGDREIYCTSTDFVRRADFNHDTNPEDYVWGRNATPVAYQTCSGMKVVNGIPECTPLRPNDEENVMRTEVIERFYLYGFAFNFEPYVGTVAPYKTIICAGRGAEKTLPGGFCEAYPEVREYWLNHTEDLLKAGFDGVIIRMQGHSSIATDYKNYGFNEPLVERYKEEYGLAAYNALMEPAHTITDEEALRLMAIRGEFFLLYAQEASALCHKYGKEFAVMMREFYEDPIISSRQDEVGWWCMPKVLLDWKAIVDLSDCVVIKDYIHKESEVAGNALEIREYAKSQGKKVWIECFDDQAGMLTDKFFEEAIANDSIDGILIYELTGIERYISSNLAGKLKRWGFERANPLEQ